jgi:spore coat protein U-like protein
MKLRTTIVSLTSMALLCSVGLLPAQAAKHHVNPNATANIGVTGTVLGDCTITPGAYASSFTYDPITDAATETSPPAVISYTCTNGAPLSYEVSSPQGTPPAWNATGTGGNLAYILYAGQGNVGSCASLTYKSQNGVVYNLWSTGTGGGPYLSYCANAASGQPTAVEGSYSDTVTLTLTAS